jgi:hypothetical protein
MTQKSLSVAVVCLCLHLTTVIVCAQDFQKSIRLAAGSRVNIQNVAGDVLVQGYDGDTILVSAFKEGRDRDRLTIKDFSTDSSLDVRVRYPQNCNCEATIRFEVNVPRATEYNYDGFTTVAGNIKVEDAKGRLHVENVSGLVLLKKVAGAIYASSLSGDVTLEQAAETMTWTGATWSQDRRRSPRRYFPGVQPVGSVVAKSISGKVQVSLLQLLPASPNRMEFSSLSGSVEVRMPESLGAQVEMTTTVGNVETDFPLTVIKAEYVPGGSARGRLGDGSHELKISSIAGNVSLRKNQ